MENKTKNYKEPEIEIIRMTEVDIITTSGGDGPDKESEIIPFDNLGR